MQLNHLKNCLLLISALLSILAIDSWATSSIVEASNYSELRSMEGLAGSKAAIATGTAKGVFTFTNKDPHGHGDDGGTVIQAKNGWWVRDFNHSKAQPIKLDWYQLENSSDITDLVLKLAKAYSPYLYLQSPIKPLQVELNYIDLTATTKYFYLLGEEKTLTIRQKAWPTNRYTLLRIDNYKEIFIDKGITFEGRHDLFANNDEKQQLGLLRFSLQKGNASFFKVFADINNSPNFGIAHSGGKVAASNRHVKQAIIGGRFYNSGIRINSGVKALDLDNVHILDPIGMGLGWNPMLSIAHKIYREKHHGIWLQNIETLTGKLLLEYGGASWFMSSNKYIGHSIEDPFIIEDRQIGWLYNGTKVSAAKGMRAQTGKIDGLFHPFKKGNRFIKLISDGRNQLSYPFVIEASPEGARDYYANNIHLELVGLKAKGVGIIGEINKNNKGGKGYARGISTTGTIDQLLIQDASNSAYKLKTNNIIIKRNSKQLETRPDNIVVDDTELGPDGSIIVKAGKNILIDGLLTKGKSRELIMVKNANENDPISISIKNICVPIGTKITAEKPDKVAVKLNGQKIALPFTFSTENACR